MNFYKADNLDEFAYYKVIQKFIKRIFTKFAWIDPLE